jgi:hypothetical protein
MSSWVCSTNASTCDRGTMMRGDPCGFGIASSPVGWPSTDVMSLPFGGSIVYTLGSRLCLSWCPIHWFRSLNAGIGCLGTFFHFILLFSKTGVMALVSCSLLCLSPVVIVLAAGDHIRVSDRLFARVTGKVSAMSSSF